MHRHDLSSDISFRRLESSHGVNHVESDIGFSLLEKSVEYHQMAHVEFGHLGGGSKGVLQVLSMLVAKIHLLGLDIEAGVEVDVTHLSGEVEVDWEDLLHFHLLMHFFGVSYLVDPVEVKGVEEIHDLLLLWLDGPGVAD